MGFWQKLRFWQKDTKAKHLRQGERGEEAARKFLQKKGLKFLVANFVGKRGEIDLVFRDGECLVFAEVKTRTIGGWTRPSRAVDLRKRRAIIRTAGDYLGLLDNPQIAYRFDVIEVLVEGEEVREVRHLENSFNSTVLRRRAR